MIIKEGLIADTKIFEQFTLYLRKHTLRKFALHGRLQCLNINALLYIYQEAVTKKLRKI